jgi:hypothetical protein
LQRRKASPQWQTGFIPKDKSVESASLIAQVYQTGELKTGQAQFLWGRQTIACQIEAMPIQRHQERIVVTLLKSQKLLIRAEW